MFCNYVLNCEVGGTVSPQQGLKDKLYPTSAADETFYWSILEFHDQLSKQH